MRVYFKVDKNHKMWLLWCHSIRSTIEDQMLKKLNKKKYNDTFIKHKFLNSPLNLDLPKVIKLYFLKTFLIEKKKSF